MKKIIWLVIPCYNEQEVLPETSRQLEWEAEIKSRVNGEGCPYCANKKVLETFTEIPH